MKVNPISEADAMPPGLWKRGIYEFEVVEAKEKLSKAGNEMIEALVKVYDKEGKWQNIFDYLVSSDGMAYKVRHFAAACGMLVAYEKGELRADDFVGKTGRCQVGIQKDKNGQYPDKNTISDYLPAGTQKLIASVDTKDIDDEIPF
jgi:hypothetical protein